ncbi:hypothetical protein [Polynucleobacter sp. UB-Tiil-W10]|uniref:hypothetical protein n=1 Tax=Polynucleobacter sp. UB-Tiil-W10 TaxID=1855648 RepID=UPI001C0D9646|nr:hypothetical protein [Polynucleobacter sp. UB-Tiil-W10]MBU3539927.1 hypothetical protein [Polynucleobacter sp. UB-Tiil-W10]
MKLKMVTAALGLASTLAWSQTPSNMVGTWSGVSNSAVSGSGMFHPTEAGKEKAVRFRNVEYVLVVDKEEGRNFVGFIGATNGKHPTDIKHKEVVLGAYAKDMKSGVMVNETGSFTFKLVDSKNLEICYTQVTSKPMVASCFEMIKK